VDFGADTFLGGFGTVLKGSRDGLLEKNFENQRVIGEVVDVEEDEVEGEPIGEEGEGERGELSSDIFLGLKERRALSGPGLFCAKVGDLTSLSSLSKRMVVESNGDEGIDKDFPSFLLLIPFNEVNEEEYEEEEKAEYEEEEEEGKSRSGG